MEETTWIFMGATLALTAYAFLSLGFFLALHARDPGSAWLDRWIARCGADSGRQRRVRFLWWGVLVPGVACLSAAVLAVFNVGIMEDREVEDIYAVSAAIVASVRILAYLWQPPALLLARMVPYAVMSAAVFNTHSFDWDTWWEQLREAGTENAVSFIIILVLLEWGLRSGHNWRSGVAERNLRPKGDEPND